MKNSEQEIQKYEQSRIGRWDTSTCHTVRSKLRTILHIGLDPNALYNTLVSENYSLYTTKVYFILARDYEEKVKKTSKIRVWMFDNRLKFKNCYKTKTTQISELDMTEAFKISKTDDEYNFMVLGSKAGLRKFEIGNARWEHIKNNEIEVPNGKGRKQRFMPFNASWLKSPKLSGPIINSNVKFEYKGYTSHDLRVYYANKIVNMPGMELNDAMLLLGHSNLNTTGRYLRPNIEKRSKLILENL